MIINLPENETTKQNLISNDPLDIKLFETVPEIGQSYREEIDGDLLNNRETNRAKSFAVGFRTRAGRTSAN